MGVRFGQKRRKVLGPRFILPYLSKNRLTELRCDTVYFFSCHDFNFKNLIKLGVRCNYVVQMILRLQAINSIVLSLAMLMIGSCNSEPKQKEDSHPRLSVESKGYITIPIDSI